MSQRLEGVPVDDEGLDEESWDVRETFAFFGRAFYMASVLETGLVHALLFGEFLMSVRDQFVATKGRGFDRGKYEEEFDRFCETHFAKTMGNLIRLLEASSYLDDELKAKIVAAKARRDFLVHHYWRERSVEFASQAGRRKMREELHNDTEEFAELDRKVDDALKPVRKKVGIDDEKMNAESARIVEELTGRSAADR